MCPNVPTNPPLSGVYRDEFINHRKLVWDLSDPRITSHHLENAIPMALLYWTREKERIINNLQELEIRVPVQLEAKAYCLFLQKKLFNPALLTINIIFAGGPQDEDNPVFPQDWHDLIIAPPPTIEQIQQIMAEANLPIPQGLLFYQNVSNMAAGVVQGRIFGLKVLTINLASLGEA